MNRMIGAALAVATLTVLTQSALAQPAGAPPPGMSMGGPAAATPVGIVVLQPQSVPLTTTLPGRVTASATAQVRPQVGGIITAVAVKEGQPVKAGDLLFTIDDKNYQAEVAAAEANLASANAQLPSAEAKVTRYETLVGSGGVSQSDLDTAKVELAQAKASVQSAEAQLAGKQITLDQTKITAPISGMLGTLNAEIGSLVTASQADALATIRTVDPSYIELVESSVNILALRSDGDADPAKTRPPLPKVNLTLEDGRLYDQEGTISSSDLVVSETTGTVTMRATIPNPERILLPGMFVRAHIAIGEQENAFLVPQRAVTFNSRGEPTAYFVTADNKAEQRVLTATRDMNNAWVVTAGVTAGDKLIVDGLQKISDGSAVAPLEVTISEDGVIAQDMSAIAAPAAAAADAMAPAGATAPDDAAATTTETAK
ncbi:efflux RND transporter periplasmic adaptor subunit [Devosia sp.]|uniref:efflux RND transporter periplasmic adaptor subunit n=1 Tax=Devosia sp. TaxID=1871048 RepID=UPI003BA9F5D0